MNLRITMNCDNPATVAELLTAYAGAIKDGDVRNEYLRDIKGNCVGEAEVLADADAEIPPGRQGQTPPAVPAHRTP